MLYTCAVGLAPHVKDWMVFASPPVLSTATYIRLVLVVRVQVVVPAARFAVVTEFEPSDGEDCKPRPTSANAGSAASVVDGRGTAEEETLTTSRSCTATRTSTEEARWPAIGIFDIHRVIGFFRHLRHLRGRSCNVFLFSRLAEYFEIVAVCNRICDFPKN
jgi:hypothetical protein